MKHWAVGCVVAGLLLAGCTSGSDDPGPSRTSPSDPAPTSDSGLTAAWSTAVGDSPATFTLPDEGTNPLPAGDLVLTFGTQQVTAIDVATGAITWVVNLPEPVCAAARTVNDDGVAAVLLGSEGECRRAVALDTGDGRVLWTAPIPRAGAAFGHEVSIGADSVVVAGECAGFSLLSVADGSVVDTVTGATVDGKCASATSDGSSVVLLSRGRFSVFDAGTGRRSTSLPAEGVGRVGDVVAVDPLVVSARFGSGGHLFDLSGAEPRAFGRDRGGFGGEPAASVRLGDTLWLQYDDVDTLVGVDIATGKETGTVQVGLTADLLGAHDDRLVVTIGQDLRFDVHTWLVDPAMPDAPEDLGALPAPTAQDTTLPRAAVVGDHLVRLWDGRVDAIPLP